MKAISFILLSVIVTFYPQLSKAQSSYGPGEFAVDSTLRLIICDRALPGNTSDGYLVFGSDQFSVVPNTVFTKGTPYTVTKNGVNYTLYFTQSPIVNLSVPGSTPISRDYTVPGTISVCDSNILYPTYAMTIAIRGATSSTYPKKSFQVKLQDASSNDLDASFLGMREDQTWLLLAMWDEPMRMNNFISANLWRKIHTLYYSNLEPKAVAAARSKYVEVVLNGRYQGLYLLSEKMDRKELQLKKAGSQGQVKGELYKGDTWGGANTFDNLPSLASGNNTNWGGWSVDYPDTTDWINMYNLTKFVVQSTDSTFRDSVFTYMQKGNLIDYFIFMNLLRADDNVGKNIFWAKYTVNEPYFIAPWDMNGTWGYYYDASHVSPNPILSNGLYTRLQSVNPASFNSDMADRWFQLRETTLSNDSIGNTISSTYGFLLNDGAYDREKKVWTYGLNYSTAELNYMLNWSSTRLSVLDAFFSQFRSPVPLPVVITDFKGKLVNNQVELSWTCVNEENIDEYGVLKSNDGSHFNLIGTLKKNGTGDYKYCDGLYDGNKVFYQLKLIASNRDASFSKIIAINEAVSTPVESQTLVYPNPATDYLQLNWTGQLPEKIVVTDSKGKIVLKGAATAREIKLDVSAFSSGVYFLKIGDRVFSFVKK